MQLWYIFHTPFQIIIPRSEFFSYLFLFQPDKKFDVVSLFFNERAYSLVFYSKCYLRSLNICLFVLKFQNFWKEAVSIKPCFIRFSFNFLQITCRFFVVYMPYSFCQNTCTQRLGVVSSGGWRGAASSSAVSAAPVRVLPTRSHHIPHIAYTPCWH